MHKPAMVGSSLDFTKASVKCFSDTQTLLCTCRAWGLPASPNSETTTPTASTEGGKTSQAFTLLLSVPLKFYGKGISKELFILACYHILCPACSTTSFWPVLELVFLFLVFLPNLRSNIPSLKRAEAVSQAWICISSNPLFNKHPYSGAAAWTVTSNMSLSIWITRERDLSCCRRFTYGIFTGAA